MCCNFKMKNQMLFLIIMKYIILLLFLLGSCQDARKESVAIKNKVKLADQINSDYPYRTEEDSGYFKGYDSYELKELGAMDDNELSRFFSSILKTKQIILLSNYTLSHSVLIDPQKKLRYDTLKNDKALMISEYYFGDKEYQKITFNGRVIRNYRWNGIDSLQEDIFDVNHESFRYFSFKGKDYLYFNATIMGMGGVSAGNIVYQFLYDINTPSSVQVYSCRFEDILVGDVDGDEFLDFLHFDNSDFCTTVPSSDNALVWLYSSDEKGEFKLRKDLKGREYFIEGNTGEGYRQDSFIMKKYSWPVPIPKELK